MKYPGHSINLSRVDSTSAFIKRRRRFLKDVTFVSAREQTNGRGRLGRSWESEAGKNLLFSLFTDNPSIVGNYRLASLASAAAIVRALKPYLGDTLSVKWPNDVLCNGRKICGILLEGLNSDGKMTALIIGTGLNVNQTVFNSSAYNQPPTSLQIEKGRSIKLPPLKKAVYNQFRLILGEISSGNFSFINEVQSLDYLKGRTCFAEIDGTRRQITVIGINPDGSLKITDGDSDRDLISGEISFHL